MILSESWRLKLRQVCRNCYIHAQKNILRNFCFEYIYSSELVLKCWGKTVTFYRNFWGDFQNCTVRFHNSFFWELVFFYEIWNSLLIHGLEQKTSDFSQRFPMHLPKLHSTCQDGHFVAADCFWGKVLSEINSTFEQEVLDRAVQTAYFLSEWIFCRKVIVGRKSFLYLLSDIGWKNSNLWQLTLARLSKLLFTSLEALLRKTTCFANSFEYDRTAL